MFIHEKSDVHPGAKIGEDSSIWQYVVVMDQVVIGKNVNLCAQVLVESGVVLGNNVTVKSGVYLWSGLQIEDDVFIGPNATFTNDKLPRSKKYPGSFIKTVVRRGASIGANATILPGVEIGERAIIGAGAVVTRDVPAEATVIGNPARILDQ